MNGKVIKNFIDKKHFKSERALNLWLLKNIDFFMNVLFNKTVKNAVSEFSIPSQIKDSLKAIDRVVNQKVRVDIWVECEPREIYIIEIKNPAIVSRYENSSKVVGQLLGYGTRFQESHKMVLVATYYDSCVLEIIKKYKLPIDFVSVTEKQITLFQNY